MKCKSCKHEIDDDSIFCKYCGNKCVREKTKTEVQIPQPKKLESGTYFGRVMVDGKRVSISAPTLAEWRAKARATKVGLVELRDKPSSIFLNDAIDQFIENKRSVLSPSTIAGYKKVQKRFPELMEKRVCDIDDNVAQKAINKAVKKYSPKTVKNSWAFIKQILGTYKVDLDVSLPDMPKPKIRAFTPEEAKQFCAAVKGDPVEIAALLALHSLRTEELLPLTWADIDLDNRTIDICKTMVRDENDKWVLKDTTKNKTSARVVPIMMDQLYAVLQANRGADDERLVTYAPNSIGRRISQICKREGLPHVSVHDLRKTFASVSASLGMSSDVTQRIGGWANDRTVKAVYQKVFDADIQRATNEYAKHFNGENGNDLATK